METPLTPHLDAIESLLRQRLPSSRYQFELYDVTTDQAHGRGALTESMAWASVYKLAVIATAVQLIDAGELRADQPLLLDKQRFRHGDGVLQTTQHLAHLSIADAARLIIATSDNVCSDTLHALVGPDRVAQLLVAAGCAHSRITDNVDSLVGPLLAVEHPWTTPGYLNSAAMFAAYEAPMAALLPGNHTTAPDCNRLWRYLATAAFSPAGRELFFNIVQTPSVWARLGRYANFLPWVKMSGKTGTLGLGAVLTESVVLYRQTAAEPLAFFTILTQHNRQPFYEVCEVLAQVGAELAALYQPTAPDASPH